MNDILFDIGTLKFDEKGLIPAIVSDADTGEVLCLAYMNRQSLEKTIEGGLTCFFSRSRNRLWLKGETSGNTQSVVSITADCDKDALLVAVRPNGPACHTGSRSCFFNTLLSGPESFSMEALADLIKGRRDKPVEGSYTSYLFDKGLDKILKKVGEESTEVIIAAKGGEKKETIYEIADLAYHLLVLMVQSGISISDIKAELASRHVIDKKVKQEKMV